MRTIVAVFRIRKQAEHGPTPHVCIDIRLDVGAGAILMRWPL